jgi:type IV pilus assembly protein PilX
MKRRIGFHSRQNGAALVVGLIMLVVLTLLAVSGMNTASVELVMAGNEQFRQRGFLAAGTGIEQALTQLRFLSQESGPQVVATDVAVPGSSTDKYTVTAEYMGEDLNVPGYSVGKYIGFHYQIVSTGVSSRNAQSNQVQGAYVIQNAGQ